MLHILAKSKRENDEKEAVLGMEMRDTVMVHSARRQVNYLSVESVWIAEYIGTEMGYIYNCSIAKISRNFRKIAFV